MEWYNQEIGYRRDGWNERTGVSISSEQSQAQLEGRRG